MAKLRDYLKSMSESVINTDPDNVIVKSVEEVSENEIVIESIEEISENEVVIESIEEMDDMLGNDDLEMECKTNKKGGKNEIVTEDEVFMVDDNEAVSEKSEEECENEEECEKNNEIIMTIEIYGNDIIPSVENIYLESGGDFLSFYSAMREKNFSTEDILKQWMYFFYAD